MSANAPVISLSGISKIYRTGGEDTAAIENVHLQIGSGEFVAIMGPSGSGKSTLMHIIGLLDKPSAGTYLLQGEDVGNLSPSRQARIRNREIGFVFQQFNLLPRASVLDNVLLPTIYGSGVSTRRAMELIEEVGLADRVRHRSNQLSGGQVQRVAIARALVMDPSIVLADEPTGNLDSGRTHEIMELLRQINQRGVTVAVITHEEHVAAYAQRVIRLSDGRIVEDSASPAGAAQSASAVPIAPAERPASA